MAEFELDGINSCLVFCLALVVDFETRIWNAQYLKLYIQIMYLIENTKNIFFKMLSSFLHLWPCNVMSENVWVSKGRICLNSYFFST